MKRKDQSWILETKDEGVLERIYLTLWQEIGEQPSNAALWFMAMQEFLEISGYEIRIKNKP